jgi:indolepyruvate ferredoxin oxidoreductase
MSIRDAFTLQDKYTAQEGAIILSGVQALARLPLDQHRADRRRGLRTATLISGYRGSPLGGLDVLLQQNRLLLEQHDVKFMPAVNEELAATAVLGAQLANTYPEPTYDGVLGMWYGKGPGVDRTGDVFKHANSTGIGRHGGVLAVAGDDPNAKSSTIPSDSEVAFFDAQMPIVYPGNVQDVLDLGLLAFALSRYCGQWVGFKFVTNVADEYSTAILTPNRFDLRIPEFERDGKSWAHTQNPVLLPPFSLDMEQEIVEWRLEAARRFAISNPINRLAVPAPGAWLGLVAAGKTYFDVRAALAALGLDDAALERHGIRLLKVGMPYPLEPGIVRAFADGLEEIVVIEEKRAFVELFVRDILYNLAERPRVVGKRDEQGGPLVPGYGELDPDILAPLLAARLSRRLPAGTLAPWTGARTAAPSGALLPLSPTAQRPPYFCSGCPHNRSTVVPDGGVAGGGIGCHTLAMVMDRQILNVTQMGGEGAQWVGASHFTGLPHTFQNIGDGTLFHSGSLAIRQAVAAKTNITYKILYNSAVAMTGGQKVDGGLAVPELTKLLAAEGVRRTLVVTEDPEKYRGLSLAEGVEVWARDRLDEAQRLLQRLPGVTVLIYDQRCAANLRRQRKRGEAPEPVLRAFINEAICEGCGDCGRTSNCLSVQPVETEFGRKTKIHQSSCNKDYSCLDGNCPAFVRVRPGRRTALAPLGPATLEHSLPEPRYRAGAGANLYMMGIGGTGVVTVNQILGTAALLEGKYVRGLDQTGLSQKGGPVVSHLKILETPADTSTTIGVGEADTYLAFDVLTAADSKHLRRAHPERTVAVVSSSKVPTGMMVRSTAVAFPADHLLRSRIDAVTCAEENVYLDAEALALARFGSHLPTNLIVVGAAYQTGVIPLRAESIERAIELNGVSVQTNLAAFRVGRAAVANPGGLHTEHNENSGGHGQPAVPALTPQARALIEASGASGELRRLLEIRVPELIAYQNVAYAQSYVHFVGRVNRREQEVTTQTRLSEAVARYLYKLMAYKDEYEVARLALRPAFRRTLTEQFGEGAEVEYLLRPPILARLGLRNKRAFGPGVDTLFQALYRLRGLRGTPLDVFGYDPIRRVERALIAEYRRLIGDALASLSSLSYDRAARLAELPDLIRGYDEVKLANVQRYHEAQRALSDEAVGETSSLTRSAHGSPGAAPSPGVPL